MQQSRAHELRESRGGRPGLLVPNSPYMLCRCRATLEEQVFTHLSLTVLVVCRLKATLEEEAFWNRAHKMCESQGFGTELTRCVKVKVSVQSSQDA